MKIKALNEPDVSDTSSDESSSNDNLQQGIGKEKLEDLCFERYQRALIAVKDDNQDDAKALLEELEDELRDIQPESETLYQLKFSVYKNLGHLVTGNIDHYVKALEIDPSDISLWIKAGDRGMRAASYRLARYCYEQALKINPKNWIAIDRLIELYYILHLPFELFDLSTKALETNKDYTKAAIMIEEAKKYLPCYKSAKDKLKVTHSGSIVEKLDVLKKKRQHDLQEELQKFKRARLSINLDTTRTQSLSSFGNYIIKIYERFAKQFITRNTMIDITINSISSFSQQFKGGSINSQSNNQNSNDLNNTCSQDIEMSNEGEGASNSENDKLYKDKADTMVSSDENEHTKSNSRGRQNQSLQKNSSLSFAAMLFPMDLNDKRRSSRNRNNNQYDTFSFKLKFDELNDLLPECLRIGAIEQALQKRRDDLQASMDGKSEDTQEESVLIETTLDPVREDLIIKDVIESISDQAQATGSMISNIKLSQMFYVYLSKLSAKKQNTLPEAFMKIYKFYRKLCPLPTCVFVEIGPKGVDLEELWFTLTANEITYQQKECFFLLRILEQLALFLDESQHKEFIVRLFLILGLHSDYRYLEVALQNIEEDTRVYASNRKIITRAHIKTLIDKKTEMMQQESIEDLDNSVEILDRLGPKSENEISDREVQLLCNAIKSTGLWQRGLDILNQRNDLNSDIIIETMNLCLKNGAKMDAILASKLCKEAISGTRPTTWSCLYRGWIRVLDPSEATSPETISNIDKFFDIGHQTLGKKNTCTSDKGEFLMLHVAQLLDEERENFDDRELLNSLHCLFGYPSKRPAAVAGHKAVKVPMIWDYAQTIYTFFEPEELPTYMSLLRKAGITSEVESIFREIANCVPPDLDPKSGVQLIEDFIERGKPLIEPVITDNQVTNNVFYFLADYYFKNKEFAKAKEFYNYDLVINPKRFDSWAASGLLRASGIDKALSEGYVTTSEFVEGWFYHLANTAIRCFERATHLRPDEPKATLWIEFGNLTYNLTSFAARLYIYDDFEFDIDGKASEHTMLLVGRHKYLYNLAKRCFKSANRLCMCDEVWLHYYMLGKIYEKTNILKALEYYSKADAQLFHEGASYPRKISYHNPPELAYEAMEVHYRMHAAVLKYLLSSNDMTVDQMLKIKRYILNAQRSPFVELEGCSEPKKAMEAHIETDVRLMVSDLVDSVVEEKESSFDHLIFMCLHGMKRCLVRCDKNFKALYRLAFYYRNMRDPKTAQDILMSRELKTDRRIENLLALRPHLPIFMTTPPDLRGVDSLFKDRKQGNLFANIWRMPIEEIDRPGCFEHWMFKSVWLLIRISIEMKDANTLSLVSFQLSREPEVSKKYLHNRPRILLGSFAIKSLIQVIMELVERAPTVDLKQKYVKEGISVADRFLKSNLHTDKIRDLYNHLQSQLIVALS